MAVTVHRRGRFTGDRAGRCQPRGAGQQPFRGPALLDPARGAAREVVIPPNVDFFPNPSPTQPFVALYGAGGASDPEIRFLKPDGTLTEPIALPSLIFFTRWSEDGASLRGVHSADGADGNP